MVFDLLSIRQGDSPGLGSLGVAMIAASVVLVFTILMLLGSRLFDLPCVFIVVIAVRMPSDCIDLNISHGL